MSRPSLSSVVIVSCAWWLLIAFLMLGQIDCIAGNPEYPCQSATHRTVVWAGQFGGGLLLYLLGLRWLYRRDRS